MKVGDKLKREDGIVFEVVEANHWSLVMSVPGSETVEEDRVKWCAGVDHELYVGHYSRKSYTLLRD